ncbi:hypothetical protein [Chitinophaga tropicalis]|uniref:TerB family tellurite resistance protein n=1 Tax=Chitinophaga tropicalis TaxID=2683588 RepID=A0A7K1U075_9BACT|nr:hypothetical protein [Chitinophaga tropicalis]MVT07700.1 hypothetical protein [Chitinophaga tropicalis]
MKHILITVILLVTVSVQQAGAQTFNEWFKQKKTQIRYLVEQIGQLQLYLGYVKKGYNIAQGGLSTISNIRNGEWDLHKDFFGSLKIVNPRIRDYGKIAQIISNQQYVVRACSNAFKQAKSSEQFTQKEIDYLMAVYDNLLTQSVKNIDDLLLYITSGKLEMTDDQRIQAIDRVHVESVSQQVFASGFSEDLQLEALRRKAEKNDATRLQHYYHLKPLAP